MAFVAAVLPGRAANDQEAAQKTSVWEVSARGGDATVYLVGSIHLLREQDHPLPAAFEQAYRSSEGLVLEIASDGGDEARMESMRRGMYGGGGSIRDDLSPKAYRELRKYLEGLGLPPDGMDGFRPWMAAMMISLTEMMKLGGKAELGVDSFFEGRANADGKPVEGLETSEFQIGLFAKLGREDQEAMLQATLRDMRDIEAQYPRMVKAWRTGDDAALDKILNDSLGETPHLRALLLDKRNARWVEKLEGMIGGERDLMVVVGAGHLIGEQGLVSRLEAKGYEVKRMPPGGKVKPPRFIEL